jgi:hypothetical protein
MKNDFIYDEMINLGADGVDFVPIWLGDMSCIPILSSFSKEEWLKETCYPKTNRRYWKMDEKGNKIYINF